MNSEKKNVESEEQLESIPEFKPVKFQSNRINRNLLKKEGNNNKFLKKKKTVSLALSSQGKEEEKSHTKEEKEQIKIKSQAIYDVNQDKIDDVYLKNLQKVNKIKVSDDFIVTVLKEMQLTEIARKKIMRYKSSVAHVGGNTLHLQAIDTIAKKNNIFDRELDDDSKLTLENTILNKFQKEVSGAVTNAKK